MQQLLLDWSNKLRGKTRSEGITKYLAENNTIEYLESQNLIQLKSAMFSSETRNDLHIYSDKSGEKDIIVKQVLQYLGEGSVKRMRQYLGDSDNWQLKGLSDSNTIHEQDTKLWLARNSQPIVEPSFTVVASPEKEAASDFRKRAVLTADTAAAIFKLRGSRNGTGPLPAGMQLHAHTGRSVLVSRMFGISPKAVRDIWNLRTWRHVTDPLRCLTSTGDAQPPRDTAAALAASTPAVARPVGRPRGSKDSRPRRRRAVVTTFGPSAAVAPASSPAGGPAIPDLLHPGPQPPSPAANFPTTQVWWSSPGTADAAAAAARAARAEAARQCPVRGPPASTARPLTPPSGVAEPAPGPEGAGPEESDAALRRSFPFFLDDPRCWA